MLLPSESPVDFSNPNEFRSWLVSEIKRFDRAAAEGPFYPDKYVTRESYLRMAELTREELCKLDRACLHLVPE